VTSPIVVDSSGWLEFFADAPQAEVFATAIREPALLRVPATTIYEVYRVSLRERNAAVARVHVAAMLRSQVIPIDSALAVDAAELAHELGLSMADATILASARRHGAELWTTDADFSNIPGVRLVA
jgi:predicted nucleic acid-binding protein